MGSDRGDVTETAPLSGVGGERRDGSPPAAEPEGHVKPGDNVGRYTVRHLIGAGGMGEVYAALDGELGRTVAIKLLHSSVRTTGTRARARLLREAQALARLHHPNVVTVHDVGTDRERVFIAMELVEGPTLRDWLRQGPRGWREVRDAFVAAGRGLAAAHAAGIVHRDFKPHNVIVSHDRVVVVDFGLARAGAEEEDSPTPASNTGAMLGTDLTLTGERVGTPMYMAPEAIAGGTVTAKSDQFAFSVALFEALYGRTPFSGRSLEELADAVKRGPQPPAGAGVPRFLSRAAIRGLAAEPADRFPSMDALLAELERDPARARRRAAVIAFAVAGAGVLGWLAVSGRPSAAERCEAARGALAGVWDGGARDAARAHLVALDPQHGAERFAAAAATLDGYAAGWGDMSVAACRATRVSGTQSDTLLDLRAHCLERRLGELRGAARALTGATDLATLDRSMTGLGELTALDGCADTVALSAAAPPPEQPAKRAADQALVRELDEIRQAQRAGRLEGLRPRAQVAVYTARALDHAPTLAAALRELALVAIDGNENTVAIETLRELTQVAARAHDADAAAFAWTHLLRVLGNAGRSEEAVTLVQAASAAVLLAGPTPHRRAELLYNEASVLDRGKRTREALERLGEARKILLADGGTKAPSPHLPLLAQIELDTGIAEGNERHFEASLAAHHRAIELWRQAYGPDHPVEALGWHDLGEQLRRQGRPADALAAYREAARIKESRVGDGASLVLTLTGMGCALQELGRYEDSLPILERALTMARAHLPPGDRGLVNPLVALAVTDHHVGRVDEALRADGEVIEIYEKSGAKDVNLPITLFNRGDVARGVHRCNEALADYRRAAALFEEYQGPTAVFLVFPLQAEGTCLNELRRFAEAIPILERAVGIPTPGLGKMEHSVATFELGRALVESGRDRGRGTTLARSARAELAAQGKLAAGELARLDAWLAQR